jgi:murein DD-endopeptidase MepM/ murein hydrolase activator NlpD
MLSFLQEFTRSPEKPFTIIVLDEDQMEQPRRYRVKPAHVLYLYAVSTVVFGLLLVGLVVLTPLRELIPGYGTQEMRRNARLNTLRLTALQDSLEMQYEYVRQLRYLMMGELDSMAASSQSLAQGEPDERTVPAVASEPMSQDWEDHEQPALPVNQMPVRPAASEPPASVVKRYLSSLIFPVQPPVNGFLTRGYDARTGHYAVDFAVAEGTSVRSIGDGYVIFADWAQEGGFTIAIQHADGYVSVYKHNQQLMKRVGDRVRDREVIAKSGNSGEISTGPHLHFELWYEGLAQDPRYFLVGE